MTNRIITRFAAAAAAACVVAAGWPSAAHAATDRLGTPSNLRVTVVSYDSVSLAWDPAAGSVAYYQVLRNGYWVDSSYGTTATVRYLASGTTYRFEVRARDYWGNVSPSVSVSSTTKLDANPPTTPANLRVVKDSAGRLSGLTWDASTDDRGVGLYWLFANGDVAFGGGQGADFLTLTEVECTLFHGETYTFTVRAMDLTGNLSDSGTPVTLTVP